MEIDRRSFFATLDGAAAVARTARFPVAATEHVILAVQLCAFA